jgi:hypothetical protein
MGISKPPGAPDLWIVDEPDGQAAGTMGDDQLASRASATDRHVTGELRVPGAFSDR